MKNKKKYWWILLPTLLIITFCIGFFRRDEIFGFNPLTDVCEKWGGMECDVQSEALIECNNNTCQIITSFCRESPTVAYPCKCRLKCKEWRPRNECEKKNPEYAWDYCCSWDYENDECQYKCTEQKEENRYCRKKNLTEEGVNYEETKIQ